MHLKLDIEREIEMRNIVEIKEVFKTIDKEEILSGINLQIAEGEIYGFLGPNGAGKTTLMKCMLSLSTITSGSIEIFGKNLQEHREEILSQIGSIIESPIFYDNCTAKEILEIHAQYMGKNIIESDIIRALKMVGLKNTTKKVKDFSLGMRQRLGLAALLSNASPGSLSNNIADNLFFLIFASFISLMITSFSISSISRQDLSIK